MYRRSCFCWPGWWVCFDKNTETQGTTAPLYSCRIRYGLPYCATPEELVCQRETLDEILAVLALCTDTQRERFLLYALYDFSYAEIGRLCGCSKSAVEKSVSGVKNIFKKFWK